MVNKVILENGDYLKEVFINLMAISSYPAIGVMELGELANDCKIKEETKEGDK